MVSLYGPQKSIRNVLLLAHKFLNGKKISHTSELKGYFLQFLGEHQPEQPLDRDGGLYVQSLADEIRLKDAYRASGLNDLNQKDLLGESHSPEEKARLIQLMQDGYEYACSQNPTFKAVFDLAIHSIFFRKTNRNDLGQGSFGGSSSTAIGAIWISGQGNLTKYDIAEFLVHELTHHLLFIAERCEAQFHYREMVKQENFAQSAILFKRRPLDKVVHSIAVSTEILLAREKFLPPKNLCIHPASDIIRKQTETAIDSVLRLKNLEQVVTPWTIQLLEDCRNAIQRRVELVC